MGDKLRSQSWVIDLFIVSRTSRIEKFKACMHFGVSSHDVSFFDRSPLKSFCLQNVSKLSQVSNLRYMIRYDSS